MFLTNLLVITFLAAAPAPKEAKPDQSKIEGEWIVEKYIQGGKENQKRVGMHFSIKDGQVSVREEGGKGVGYKIDPKTDPPSLDLDVEKIKAIYKIEGETLTIVFPKGGDSERPTKFESPDGSKVVMMILKREKK